MCDPSTGEVRWIDISEHLRQHPEAINDGPYSIEAPIDQSFSVATFSAFANHFKPQKLAATQTDVTPNLLIRPWTPADTKPTRAF